MGKKDSEIPPPTPIERGNLEPGECGEVCSDFYRCGWVKCSNRPSKKRRGCLYNPALGCKNNGKCTTKEIILPPISAMHLEEYGYDDEVGTIFRDKETGRFYRGYILECREKMQKIFDCELILPFRYSPGEEPEGEEEAIGYGEGVEESEVSSMEA